jgi:hypothetical protein
VSPGDPPQPDHLAQWILDNEVIGTLRRGTLAGLTALEKVSRSINEQVQASLEALTLPTREQMQELQGTLTRTSKMLQQSWLEAVPPNLIDLESDRFWVALEISRSGGPCMIWAPRREIVERIVGDPQSEHSLKPLTVEALTTRYTALVASREEVLEDLAAVLDDSTVTATPEQDDLASLAHNALAAAVDGHHEAAQALCAASLGIPIHQLLEHKNFADARTAMMRDPEEASLHMMRLVHIQLATANALIKTNEDPLGFNRHGTLHGDIQFYSDAHALSALLLVVAWVRELSWWATNSPSSLLDEN